jgi:hypothetical protein
MALSGLTPFADSGLLDAQPAGKQGRDPAQWGIPQGTRNNQPAPQPTPTPVAIPGGEFGMHGSFGIGPADEPGEGTIVGVPVTGIHGPADPRWQQYQSDITSAHSASTKDSPWAQYIKNPADGHPLAGIRRLQVTDITDQHAANATIVPTRDIWRAAEVIVHNVAKTLLVPIISYSERAFYNNIAIVAPQTQQPDPLTLDGTGRQVFSPANTYATTGIAAVQDPGVAVAYQPPAEPDVQPDNSDESADTNSGLEWMTYG